MIQEELTALLIEELSTVTPEMIEAGTRAQIEASTTYDSRGRRQFREATTTADEFRVIWLAMLMAKLGAAVDAD